MIKQKRGISNCGQCCLATILSISLEESIKLIGHNKETTSKELTKHFISSKNKRGIPDKDALCILRFDKSNRWHWIIKYKEGIYDPLKGSITNMQDYFDKNPNYRITSHFLILN